MLDEDALESEVDVVLLLLTIVNGMIYDYGRCYEGEDIENVYVGMKESSRIIQVIILLFISGFNKIRSDV